MSGLLDILGVTKQSLNRVLRALLEDGLVRSRVGKRDRRERLLYLTTKGTPIWNAACPRRSAPASAPPTAPPAHKPWRVSAPC